ncbi:MAG: lysylphosphatidylglycerol synthase transmembrane domain-containing protein [Hyphomicrobiales bacterium]
MKKRSLVTTIASTALALGLLAALIISGHVDLASLLRKLTEVRLLPFLGLVLATSLHVLLAGEKWRLVEERLTGGAQLSRRLCFAFTALGTAAGQFLPMQVATALTRSMGSRFLTGAGAVRSALATLFEQAFDVLAIGFCGLASIYCLSAGDLARWPAGAALAAMLGWLLAAPAVKVAAAGASRLATAKLGGHGGIGRLAGALARSGLFEPGLVRRLFALSIVRFIVLCLMAAATTQAAGLDMPTLRLAAALPLVVLATALALTPAGIGVNEWSFAAALTAFGADFEVATQWALMNRVLVAAASLLIGGAGGVLAFASRAGTAPADAPAGGQEAGALAGAMTRSVPQDNPAI